jgi:CO/xanthine dehydrogenase FAD-binding subunit
MPVATSRSGLISSVATFPWRVANAERLLVGRRVTPELTARVGEAAIADARPLAKNGYKYSSPVQSRRTLTEMTAKA